MYRFVLASAAAAAMLFTVPALAPAGSGDTSAGPGVIAEPAAKSKAKKCRRGQVRVRLAKRRTVCRPFKKAFPKPRAGDPRQLVAGAMLMTDWSRLRDRRGRHVPSLPRLIRRAGPRAQAALQRAMTRGLARVDAVQSVRPTMGGSARSDTALLQLPAWAAAAQAGCGGSLPRTSDRFRSGGGGEPVASVAVTTGPDGAALGIDLSANGTTVSVDVDLGLCEPNEVEAPACPVATGQLDGRIRYKLKVAVNVSQGGQSVWSQAMEVTRTTRLSGWNEVDAKLESLDVDDLETSTLRLGGSGRAMPPITIRTRITRRTRVDMRSGAYDPGRSQIDATISMAGLQSADRSSAEAEFERSAQADADRQFGAVVAKAIAGYRSRESGWQKAPNPCAEIRLTPASDSRTLEAGASGSFSVAVIAKSDGDPAELDARLSETENAAFAPMRAGGQPAVFGYSQVNGSAPPGSKVRVKITATSKAGAAEGRWEQKIEPPFEVDRISGSFSGSHRQPIGPRTARIDWDGGATFTRDVPPGTPGAGGGYTLSAGRVTFTYSGANILAHALCDMSGSVSVDLFQAGSGAMSVFAADFARPFASGPHDYNAGAAIGLGPQVTLTMHDCAPGAESEEGKQYTIPVAFDALNSGQSLQRSPDGIHYDGSNSQSESGISTGWSWALTGEKTSP